MPNYCRTTVSTTVVKSATPLQEHAEGRSSFVCEKLIVYIFTMDGFYLKLKEAVVNLRPRE
jgi:hypothetical protein